MICDVKHSWQINAVTYGCLWTFYVFIFLNLSPNIGLDLQDKVAQIKIKEVN